MVICVCGMIGAGKSEFSKRLGYQISDFDEILDKEKQIINTIKIHEKGWKICHITCFPTAEEQKYFEKIEVKYIWVNTTFSQCRENIFRRGRKRDIENIQETLETNKKIREKYLNSNIEFEVIELFETGERR